MRCDHRALGVPNWAVKWRGSNAAPWSIDDSALPDNLYWDDLVGRF